MGRGTFRNILVCCKTLIFSILIFSFCGISHADETRTLYELYKSTSTPKLYKRHIGKMLKRQERMAVIHKKVTEKRNKKQKRLKAIKAVSQFPTKNNIIQSADASFKLGEVYSFPNPAKKTNPTFHIEVGIADKVQLYIYDVSGSLIHEAIINGLPQIIDDGQGPQYAYEYMWNTSTIASGVYLYSIKAEKSGKILRKNGKCAVIK